MKDKTTAALLALFLGGIGFHRFYLGKQFTGILYLIFCWTFIPTLLGFIESLVLFSISNDSFNAQYNRAYAIQEYKNNQENISLNKLRILKELNELKENGVISEDEFESKKKNLI